MSEVTATPAPVAPPAKPTISFEEFMKLDLRVATVKHAEPHPNADKLLKIQLDDGSPTGRQVCAGIRGWYTPESLIGRQVIIVANLEPRKIRGEISQGMILAGSDAPKDGAAPDEGRTVVILTLEKPLPAGSVVS
ncbi:MAG: methionine--tRNA ligase subunit beta [Phycisphaeraceae bacterium]|nr:methionine--tRNA ligase subunit beta [Phycisphaerales bacterium]QOJ16817.1 MAG: methionine--tRNA ligase subunit beta [Phycisphaeraceae bacterium]